MAHSSLYDDDIVLWSEEQAEVIRRLGRTRRDLPNDLDIDNVAEEIESVGRSEMASMESFLRLLMLRLIKIAWCPTPLRFRLGTMKPGTSEPTRSPDLRPQWRNGLTSRGHGVSPASKRGRP